MANKIRTGLNRFVSIGRQKKMDTNDLIIEMLEGLKDHRSHNVKRRVYYDCKQKVKDLRLGSIPAGMRNMNSTVGWARLVVDVIAERLKLIGYVDDDRSGIDKVLRSNGNSTEISTAVSESLLYGVGFLSVSKGAEGEGSEVILTSENAMTTTVITDRRTRRVTAAITVDRWDVKNGMRGWLHTEEYSVPFTANLVSKKVEKDEKREVIEHGYGFVPVFPIVNRRSSAGAMGRSEISEAIMGYIDTATRTLVEMEVARSLYANPRLFLLGVEREMFKNEDGTYSNPLAESQHSGVAIPASKTGTPSVNSVSPGNPSAFTEILRSIATQVSAESAIPVYRMSLADSNPTSAEAIMASELPLTARCESKISSLRVQFRSIGRAILTLLGVEDEEELMAFSEPIFAEPTAGVNTLSVRDLVDMGAMQADSLLAMQRLGFSREETALIRSENDRAAGRALIAALSAEAEAADAQDAGGE